MGTIYNSGFTGDRGQDRGPTTAEIFRNNLYKFGKFAGTAKVTPGVAGSRLANTINQQRNYAYPIARWLGNFDAYQKRGQGAGQGFLARGIQRGGRIVSGSISGRLINVAARPLGQFGLGAAFGPLAARGFRIMLGKQLMKNNPIDDVIRNITTKVTSTAVVDGKAINWKIRKDKNIQREAQKVLLMAYRNILAMAPDVSSGQYHVGGFGNQKNTKLLNKDLMMDVKTFQQLGIAYHKEGGGKEFRDIFGFTVPGQARTFLLNSVVLNNMRATKGQSKKVTSFFKGSVDVGGSIKGFPWIWAVEYGGDIPVYYPQEVKGQNKQGRKGSRKPINFDKQGNPIYSTKVNESDSRADQNKALNDFQILGGAPKRGEAPFAPKQLDYTIPGNAYVQPSFFIHRAAEKAAAKASKMTTFQQAKVTSPGSKYYNEWMKLAKRDAKKLSAKKLRYADKMTNRSQINKIFRENYQLNRGPGANMMSFMENKIPGPRTESAHGSFYSPELADAIGIKLVPEEFNFSFAFRTYKTDTAPVLRKAAEVYIRRGGLTSAAAGKSAPGGGTRGAIYKAIRDMPGRKRMGDAKNMEDANRYFDLFAKYTQAQGNVSNMHRRAEYLDKVFDFSVKLTPGGRRATVGLRRKRGTVSGNKQNKIERAKQEKLGRDIFKQLDIEELMKEIGDF